MKKIINRIVNKLLKIAGVSRRYPYEIKTFSQSGEDVIINFIFNNLLKIKKPTYLDVGAHHPFFLSNTAFFI